MKITVDNNPPPQLTRHVIKIKSEPFTPPKKDIYASELDGCIRKSWYRRKYNKPPEEESAYYLWFGTKIHEDIQEAYTNTEQRHTLPLGIGCDLVGRVDAVNDEGDLLEFKTVKNPYFINKKDEPNPWDRNRTLLYMWLGGYTTGHIYYFHGDIRTPRHYTLHLENTPEDLDMILALQEEYRKHGLALRKAIIEDTPPPPLNKREKIDCRFCEFKDECIKYNHMGEKKV